MLDNRLSYYLLGIPIVAVTLLYTSIVRRFFYLVPVMCLKMLGAINGLGRRPFIAPFCFSMTILILMIGNGVFSLPANIYIGFIDSAAALWEDGHSTITSLEGMHYSQPDFGNTLFAFGIYIPKAYIAAGMGLLVIGLALNVLVDRFVRR